MARIEVVMPQMGESIAEGTIVKWYKHPGETVRKDETLLEISTDKVDSEIPSPAAGVLVEITVPENQTVPVHTVIAYLESDVTAAVPKAAPLPEQPVALSPSVRPEAVAAENPPAKRASEGRFYSPLVLTIARTEGVSMLELEQIPGTGESGRVSKKDILGFVERRKAGDARPAKRESVAGAPQPSLPSQLKTVDDVEMRKKYPLPDYEVLQMSPLLHRMAEHMLQSVRTSPHVSAVHEVDMTAVVRHRGQFAGEFERREGFKLTYTPYIVEAVVAALKRFPLVNCSVEGDKIIRKNFLNIGLAVASETGLIVPVIKHAEEKNFVGLARAVNDLVQRTRTKKLLPEDVQGGTFSLTNYGVFGTLFGTPIINQPQVAILGTGAITKRVGVVAEMIAIRSIAYFTLSFDHRVVDGATGGQFLAAVVDHLERTDPGKGPGW
jgi:2-oxoglutarate dehydrogenase E2 component (dihydrolipoamide succinyltransferase)